MAKKREKQPVLRKSFVTTGAAVIGVALVLLVGSRLLGGGDGDTPVDAPTVAEPAVTSVPATDADGTSTAQENKPKSGGRDPFSPRQGAAPAPAPTPTPAAQIAAASTPHTWQLLSVKDGVASFLVDGKKVAGIDLKDEIVDGYTFNSITGPACVTVSRKPAAFGLCKGGAPFSA